MKGISLSLTSQFIICFITAPLLPDQRKQWIGLSSIAMEKNVKVVSYLKKTFLFRRHHYRSGNQIVETVSFVGFFHRIFLTTRYILRRLHRYQSLTWPPQIITARSMIRRSAPCNFVYNWSPNCTECSGSPDPVRLCRISLEMFSRFLTEMY